MSQDETPNVGLTPNGGNPTSGDPLLDRLEAIVAEMDRQRAEMIAANAAVPLAALAGGRLGKWERWWLLKAPVYVPGQSGLNVNPAGASRSVYEAANRARRKLQRVGLLVWYGGVHLSPLGQKIVERYRHELETGKRIRWPREPR